MLFGAFSIITTFLLSVFLWNIFRQRENTDKTSILKRRLRDYSAMKKSTTMQDDLQLLPALEHDILLGILKKVEAKNGVMATIWSLLFAGLVTATFTAAFADHPDSKAFASTSSLFLLMTCPFLILSILGARNWIIIQTLNGLK